MIWSRATVLPVSCSLWMAASTTPSSVSLFSTAVATWTVLPILARISIRGLALRKRRQMPRQPVIRNGMARLNWKDTAFQVTEFYERQLSRLSSSEHSTRFLQKGLPGVRQFNVTPDPVKELCFVPIL
jgi:hypothetical protein